MCDHKKILIDLVNREINWEQRDIHMTKVRTRSFSNPKSRVYIYLKSKHLIKNKQERINQLMMVRKRIEESFTLND